ncbi:MAG: DUF4097 family beta strand repeat-containing protein [Acidobacteria bacterium]|nr:DUF4097 family beta strand repeat-containing protein [Acidobacteriota bacterium]
MRKSLGIPAVAGALIFLAACDLEGLGEFGSSGRYTQDFHYAYPMKPGGRLSLETFNGSVEIAGWDENSVEISGTKFAPTPELRDALKVDISAAPDAVDIRTVRPSDRRGNMGARYSIKVPRKTRLERIVSSNGPIRLNDIEGAARLRTTNGRVRAEKLQGSLDAQTSNGSIQLTSQEGGASLHTSNGRIRAEDVRGSLEASTTNGAISVQLARTDPGHSVRLQTTNGSVDLQVTGENRSDVRVGTTNGAITLHLPAGTNARLAAATTNSTIKTEFDVQSQGAPQKHRLDGTIGTGGPLLDLSTTNGSIRLLKQL